MSDKVYVVPNPMTPCQPVEFDVNLCTGCNTCVNVCHTDIFIPNSEKGKPPIILYPDECWFCGSCVEHCPVSALSLCDGLPQADPDTCIICFCCQEICPEKAISLR